MLSLFECCRLDIQSHFVRANTFAKLLFSSRHGFVDKMRPAQPRQLSQAPEDIGIHQDTKCISSVTC